MSPRNEVCAVCGFSLTPLRHSMRKLLRVALFAVVLAGVVAGIVAVLVRVNFIVLFAIYVPVAVVTVFIRMSRIHVAADVDGIRWIDRRRQSQVPWTAAVSVRRFYSLINGPTWAVRVESANAGSLPHWRLRRRSEFWISRYGGESAARVIDHIRHVIAERPDTATLSN